MRAAALIVGLALAPALLLGGCGLVSKLVPGHPDRVALDDLKLIAEPDANADSATALDLVFVYDKDATSMLPKTAPDWFEHKADLTNGLGTSADVVSLQVPPEAAQPPRQGDRRVWLRALPECVRTGPRRPGRLPSSHRLADRIGRPRHPALGAWAAGTHPR